MFAELEKLSKNLPGELEGDRERGERSAETNPFETLLPPPFPIILPIFPPPKLSSATSSPRLVCFFNLLEMTNGSKPPRLLGLVLGLGFAEEAALLALLVVPL